ncbi:hypothetical protein Enr13x_29660 [Stieleria neptunia]|uniref:Uncharacterized protein n=1 Tax=Stieleria neptunia TaxID=2527979 RepID=A0A518HQJ4_9BACT|nr:hypothetical protein [Stieleria neptunia]QDV43112.1 hypothetical protein Enr13x_29660 [Stieleria neptunia]
MQSQIETRLRKRMTPLERRWLIGLIAPPLLMAAAVVLVVAFVVKMAWDDQHDATGPGFGSKTADQATVYDANTSTDHSARWETLAFAVQGLEVRFDGLLETTDKAGAFQIAPDVLHQFSDEAQPLITEMKQLLADETPVWDPSVVGSMWSYETHGSLPFIHLFEIEFHAAIVDKDADRALQTLQLLVDIAPALDYFDAFHFYVWHRTASGTHQRLIAESLHAGFWNEPDQLAKLQDQVSAFQRLSADRAGLFEPWDHPSTLDLHSAKWDHQFDNDLKNRSLIAKLAGVLIDDGTARELNSHRMSTEEAIGSVETGLRMTRTAIAIKQYRLQEKRWPSMLPELEKIGLRLDDYTMTDPKFEFGYQVDSDGCAKIWIPKDANGKPQSQPDAIPTRVKNYDHYNRHIYHYRTIAVCDSPAAAATR